MSAVNKLVPGKEAEWIQVSYRQINDSEQAHKYYELSTLDSTGQVGCFGQHVFFPIS